MCVLLWRLPKLEVPFVMLKGAWNVPYVSEPYVADANYWHEDTRTYPKALAKFRSRSSGKAVVLNRSLLFNLKFRVGAIAKTSIAWRI